MSSDTITVCTQLRQSLRIDDPRNWDFPLQYVPFFLKAFFLVGALRTVGPNGGVLTILKTDRHVLSKLQNIRNLHVETFINNKSFYRADIFDARHFIRIES